MPSAPYARTREARLIETPLIGPELTFAAQVLAQASPDRRAPAHAHQTYRRAAARAYVSEYSTE